MPHGTPDWGLVGPKKTVFGLDDLGEHAVRLGSPHLWDRRGDVLLAESFDDGMSAVGTDVSGLGAAVQSWTGMSRQGAYSVKLVAGSDGLQYAGLLIPLPYPVLSGVGLEFTFSIEPRTEFWRWRMWWDDGARRNVANVRYDFVNSLLEYYGPDPGYHTFATGVATLSNGLLANVGKLVVDFTQRRYRRFIFNDTEYDLRAHGVRSTLLVATTYLEATIHHIGAAGFNAEGYVDNVILTQNEP